MKKSLIAVVAAIASLGAQAASVTYDLNSHATAAFGAAYTFQTTNWSALLSLPQFNPALGTLTGAQLTYGGEFRTTGQVDSEDAQPADVQVDTGVLFRWRGNGASGSTNFGFSQNNNLAATLFAGLLDADSDPAPDFVGGDAAGNLSNGQGNLPQVFNIANLAAVTGAGNLNVFLDTASSLTVIGTANLSADILTQARGQIAVTYTYDERPPTQVPEPGSIALLGLALAGIAGSRKFKKA